MVQGLRASSDSDSKREDFIGKERTDHCHEGEGKKGDHYSTFCKKATRKKMEKQSGLREGFNDEKTGNLDRKAAEPCSNLLAMEADFSRMRGKGGHTKL